MGFWGTVRAAFTGRRPETRAITTLPWNVGDSVSTLGGAVTQDAALSLAPVFAATRILAGTVSTLPLKAYRRTGDDRSPMDSLPQLFKQLEDAGELVPWLHRCMTSLVLRGNAYGLVMGRDGFGFPTAVQWLNPSDVSLEDNRDTVRPAWLWNGRPIPREDVVHIPWFPLPGKVLGMSPLAAFMATINTGLAAQDYGNTWFDNGGFPTGTFRNTAKELTQEQADSVKGRLRSALQSHSPLVFGSDWEFNAITVPPDEAQFVETMRLSATQIANIYGLPPEDVGGTRGSSLTYATVELNQLDRALAMRPWLVILEHKFAALLPQLQYVKFNADAIVRTDMKTRWEVHQIAVGMGARSVDEVRALEDQPPLPDGQGKQFQTSAVKAAQAAQALQPVQPLQQPPGAVGPKRMWEIPA